MSKGIWMYQHETTVSFSKCLFLYNRDLWGLWAVHHFPGVEFAFWSRVEGKWSRVEGWGYIVKGRKNLHNNFWTSSNQNFVFTRVSNACFIFMLTPRGTCIICRCNTRVNNIEYWYHTQWFCCLIFHSLMTNRGSENPAQLFLNVVKSNFQGGSCLPEFPVPVWFVLCCL